MLTKLHVKEYEKPYVCALKKRKNNDNHQIKEHKQVDNEVHQVWVTSKRLDVKSAEAASLNVEE